MRYRKSVMITPFAATILQVPTSESSETPVHILPPPDYSPPVLFLPVCILFLPLICLALKTAFPRLHFFKNILQFYV